jgi:hypothetical protein
MGDFFLTEKLKIGTNNVTGRVYICIMQMQGFFAGRRGFHLFVKQEEYYVLRIWCGYIHKSGFVLRGFNSKLLDNYPSSYR